jgi:outer membrane protein assembly factor BamB
VAGRRLVGGLAPGLAFALILSACTSGSLDTAARPKRRPPSTVQVGVFTLARLDDARRVSDAAPSARPHVLWQSAYRCAYFCQMQLLDGSIYLFDVPIHDEQPKGHIVSLDRRTGKVRWSIGGIRHGYQMVDVARTGRGVVIADPALRDGTTKVVVDVDTGRTVRRIPVDRMTPWRLIADIDGGHLTMMRGDPRASVVTTQMIDGDPYAPSPEVRWETTSSDVLDVCAGTVIAMRTPSGKGAEVAGLDPRTGAQRWLAPLREWAHHACIDGAFYVSGFDDIERIDPADGHTVWRSAVTDGTFSEISGGAGVVLTVVQEGLVGFDARTGRRRWTIPSTMLGDNGSDESSAGEIALLVGPHRMVTTRETGTMIIDPATGRLVSDLDGGFAAAYVRNGIVQVDGSALVLFDPATGHPTWRLPLPGVSPFPRLAFADGVMYLERFAGVTAYA